MRSDHDNPSIKTHWGRVTPLCVGNLTIIRSDNRFSPGRHEAIIYTNAGILLIGILGTNFSEIAIKIHAFSFKTMNLKRSSAKWQPFCLGLNVLRVAAVRASQGTNFYNANNFRPAKQSQTDITKPCFITYEKLDITSSHIGTRTC